MQVCRNWSELDKTLSKQGILIRFRYDTSRDRIIGISFTADDCSFRGSKIDRSMSYYALDKRLGGRMLEAGERRISADSEQSRQRFAELARSRRLIAPRFGDNSTTVGGERLVVTYGER